MVGEKKRKWEKEKVKETKKDGKKFWEMIRELIVKKKEREEEVYVYTQEGDRKEIMEYADEFIGSWQNNIYQKAERPKFSFWYGARGEREKMIKEEKDTNSEIMKFPIIEEEELTEIIRKMKNGKASGVDGISTELMKFLMKDEKIRKYTVKCFNNALRENINKDWLTSMTTMIAKTKRPKILEHRPIAVTVNSSKILCTAIREKNRRAPQRNKCSI